MVTPTQRKIYHFIEDFFHQKGCAPTLQEIATGIGVKSRSLISRYVHVLHKAGQLDFASDGYRRIRLPVKLDEMALPMVGRIAAGKPIEAIAHEEKLVLTDILKGANRYALKVKGDSMIEEGILDGDIVICEKTDAAQEGQIVVALIDNQEATLKRIHFTKDGKIALYPANPAYKHQLYAAQRVCVQGVLIGLLRLPSRQLRQK